MNGTEFQHFKITATPVGTQTVTLDVQSRPVNVFDDEVLAELETIIEGLERETDVPAVIFRSGKESGFLAGADVKRIASIRSTDEAAGIIARGQKLFSRIERLPMPTVAVIHGPCMGGGLEFALACRYRIACVGQFTRIGLPEIKLGLLPAWGGTQRLPRLIGLMPALSMILQGQTVSAEKALRMGLVDLAPMPAEFEAVVEEFVGQLEQGQSPDVRPPRSSMTAWFANQTRLGRWFVFRAAKRQIARRTEHYPALGEALAAVKCGCRKSSEEGFLSEREAFCRLLFTPTCRNLLELFFQRERARNVVTWGEQIGSASDEHRKIESIGVIGAGAMGAGIAQLAAYQGMRVVLKDIDAAAVEAGMSRVRGLFDDAVHKRRLNSEEAQQRLAAITPSTQWELLGDVDLVIEAVVEREEIKQQVFAQLQKLVKPETVFASNTSSLSIARLGSSLVEPGRLAGLHFFNPVHRMELVEVVKSPATDSQTVEQLVRLVRRLGKTPVVVGDRPGFLVNRILFPYLAEAVRMACEGVSPSAIDREMRRFGMPMGPLELLDRVGLDVAAHVANSLSGVVPDSGPTADHLSAMVERGWLGTKSGRGFYEYPGGRRGRPVDPASGGRKPPDTNTQNIEQRLVLSLINEAARCLEEGIVEKAWMVDLAMVLGTGFAPFRGGPLRLADEMGLGHVVTRLKELKQTYGERFAPAETLCRLAEQNLKFYERNDSERSSGPAEGLDRVRVNAASLR